MPELPDSAKPALRDDKLSARNAQATWGGLAGFLTVLAGITGAPVLGVPALAASVCIAVLQRRTNAIDHALDDPPRDDYRRSTRPKSRRYWPGELGEGALAAASDNFALSGLRAVAYLEAAVRADERAQGAALALDGRRVEQRRLEARRWYSDAQRSSRQFAGAAHDLGLAWAATLTETPALQAARGGPVASAEEIERTVQAGWHRTGLVVEPETAAEIRHASLTGPPSDPARDLLRPSRSLSELAFAVAGFASGSRNPTTRAAVIRSHSVVRSRVIEPAPGAMAERDPELTAAADAGDADALQWMAELELRRGDIEEASAWGARLRASLENAPFRRLSYEVGPPRREIEGKTREIGPPEE